MPLIELINSPSELRCMDEGALPQIAEEIRLLLLKIIPEKGGHFSSNLGVVELTVALHYIFDTPSDKLVWDVGHQSYPHKILTGRRELLSTIRQYKGLCGFTSRDESLFDCFGAGHASTSIAAAFGILEGMRLKGEPFFSVAIIGDGALTGGLSFEALNNAGHAGHLEPKRLVVVFNDNDMSIDPNVGAISKLINHTLIHPGYNRIRQEIKNILTSFGGEKSGVHQFVSNLRKSLKTFFSAGILFESFGFRYLGPISGHDLPALLSTFRFIKEDDGKGGPYFVHVLTKKGKGYQKAEEAPLKYHGVSPFEVKDGLQKNPSPKINFQDVFAQTLIELATDNPQIIAITAAMPSGTGLVAFQKKFPDRFYDVGIAEAYAVTFAAGLATEGLQPVVAIYSTFLQRAYDQVIHDVAIQRLPIVFALDRAGLVGADGATHQGIFDLSYLRCIPNMVIMAPKDEYELIDMLRSALEYKEGPIAIRYPRGEIVFPRLDISFPKKSIPIGKAEELSLLPPTVKIDIVLIGIGFAVQSAIQAEKLLTEIGLRVAIINARFVKPLDEILLIRYISKSTLVVTIEENNGAFFVL